MASKEYDFPNAVILITDRTCFEIPKWCPGIKVERSRHEVAGALLELRKFNRGKHDNTKRTASKVS